MGDQSRKDNLYVEIEKIMLIEINRIVGNVYRGQSYSFVLKPSVTNSTIYSYINVLKVLEDMDRRSCHALVRDVLASHISTIINALSGIKYVHSDKEGFFVEPIYKKEYTKDFFYSFFLVEYLSSRSHNYYDTSEKFKHKQLFISLLDLIDIDTLIPVFGSVSSSLSIFACHEISEKSVRLNDDTKNKVMIIKGGYSKSIYDNRAKRYSDWFGQYRNQDGDFNVFIDYVIDNDVEDFQNIYNRVKNTVGSGSKRYAGEQMLFAYYSMVGKDSKATLEKLLSQKKSRGDRRETKYAAWIRLGYADKKFMRKMRSETSEEVSLKAAKSIFRYRDLYPNFHDLVSQFNDSRFEGVVKYIVSAGDKKTLLGFVGNPLASKEIIFSKINETEDEQ